MRKILDKAPGISDKVTVSKFVTHIAAPVSQTKALLPEGSVVVGVSYNAQLERIEIQWERDDLSSGYTYPIEFTAKQLKSNALPDGVKKVSLKPVVVPARVSIFRRRTRMAPPRFAQSA